MSEVKIIGHVEPDAQQQIDRIIVDDKNFADTLPELTQYSDVVIITRDFDGLNGNEIALKQVFGDDLDPNPPVGVTKAKLISVDGNAVAVERFKYRGQLSNPRASEQILGIEPYCLEYDLQDDDGEELPEWITYTIKKWN